MSLGLVSHQQTVEGISDWVQNHAEVVCTALTIARIPSRSTWRRTLAQVDMGFLEAQMPQVGALLLARLPQIVRALALDGNAVRGAQMQGLAQSGHP